MKTTLKLKEVLDLNKALVDLNLKGSKFSYAVAMNITRLKPEVDSIMASNKQRDDFSAYDKERIELAKKHAEKDSSGRPIIIGNSYKLENQEEFQKEFTELKEKHKEAIDYREQQNKELDELLETETVIDLYKIGIEEVPEEITTKQMTDIFHIIESQA